MESIRMFLLKVAGYNNQLIDFRWVSNSLGRGRGPMTDPSVAAEEREWLKVAGGSKAHLLEVPSLQGDFPISRVELYAGLFLLFFGFVVRIFLSEAYLGVGSIFVVCLLERVFVCLFAWLFVCLVVLFASLFVSLFVCLFLLRYMHCTHTTAHSTVLSSIPTAWLKAQAGLKDLAQVTV